MKMFAPCAEAAAIAFALAACSPAPSSTAASDVTPVVEPPPFQLAHPTVVMEASPPPPFIYWAPEGATIRNHPHVPGIWNAFVDDRNVASYYGDDCRASEYQRFIGQSADAMPAPPAGIEVRPSCEGCAVNGDMRANRMNVIFREDSRVVVQIACY